MCNKLPIFLGILLLFVQYVFVDASIAMLESKGSEFSLAASGAIDMSVVRR